MELKTEQRSRRDGQDEYLRAARKVGFQALLKGLLDIFRATNSKRKYFRLLKHLESMGQLLIPSDAKDIMAREGLQGINEASKQIEITTRVADCTIIYVQPDQAGDDVITFGDFRSVVERHHDPVSRRFAESLAEWAQIRAGNGGDHYHGDD